MNIDPKHLSLLQLLQDRLFQIPQYQRAYSWGRRQRKELFQDIDALMERDDGATHFMATVVVLSRGKRTVVTDSFDVVDVVDGQQRLTTLVMLLRSVQKALTDLGAHKKAQARLNELLIKDDDLSLVLLQTNHDTSHVFRDYIREGKAPADGPPSTRAEQNLVQGIRDCEEYAGARDAEGLLKLTQALFNQLTFIVHTLTDESLVYTVFEVLNSRGLSVAWIDKLKSMLMAIAFENGDPDETHVSELHEVWKEVYRALGLREGLSDEALRFAAVLLTGQFYKGRLLSLQGATEAVRDWCGGDTKKAIEASRWLCTVVEGLNRLGERPVLTPLMRISQARFVALAIELSDLSDEDKEACMAQWEKTVFRVFGIANKDARTLSGALVRLGTKVYRGDMSAASVVQKLERMAEDKAYGDIRDQLEDENCYHDWKGYLRYLLYRYEQHLAEQEGEAIDKSVWDRIWAARPDDTIEHIIPQSAANSEGFKGKLYVHRLGNLTLLPPKVNSSLQDKPFQQKKATYAKAPLYQVRALAELDKWNKKAVKTREEDIISWVEDQYS